MYRDVFACADAGMAVLSAQGNWLAANPSLCRLLARPQASLLGTRAHEDLFDASTVQRIDALCAAGAGQAATPQALEATGPDRRDWRLVLAPLHEGEATVLLQLQDIAEQVRAQRLQDHLAYGISHDLRAPLRGIAGFAARLDESGSIGDDAGRSDLTRIRAAATRAERLVDEMVVLLRAARQPLRGDEVDISLLCEWVAAELQDADPGRAAHVDVAPGLLAHGDEHRLKTLLQQVLGNAWKFSADRAQVEIAVEGHVEDGRLRLAIRDRGIGFDMRYADKLFLPFQRLHGDEQGGGNGLGLAIAQEIAQRHGGAIHAQSQPGEGSTFFIELPATAAHDPHGTP